MRYNKYTPSVLEIQKIVKEILAKEDKKYS